MQDENDTEAAETLPGRRPRRKLLTGPTVVLFALVVGVGGFLIGVQVQKDNSSSSSQSAGGFGGGTGTGTGGGGGARLRALVAGGGSGGRSGGAASAAGATIGQVASVDAGTLYVTTAQGGTIAVHTTPSSQVTRTVDASARDVHPGEQVVIVGAKNGDGSIQAASVVSNATAAGALGSLASAGGGAGAATGSGSRAGGAGGASGGGGRSGG